MAVLVALGAQLTPFFAVQIAVGLAVVAVTPLLVGSAGSSGRGSTARIRGRSETGPADRAALALGQIYFRLVIVLMSLISSPSRPATSAGRCGRWKR